MNKEPIGLYIFRFLCGFGLLAFMGMLYWSSMLLEQNMLEVQWNIDLIKNKLDLISSSIKNSTTSTPIQHSEEAKFGERKHIRAEYPNLLEEDPFYKVTLPKLLGPDFKPNEVRKTAVLGKPPNLSPFSSWAQVVSWIELCVPSVAKSLFGKYETFAPNLAIKMEARPIAGTTIQEFWVHLREGVYWQPLDPDWFPSHIRLADHFLHKYPVTAHDFKFFFDVVMNSYVQDQGVISIRGYLKEIESIRVIDDLTFVVRWKAEPVQEADGTIISKIKYISKSLTGGLRPLPRFVYQYFPDGTKILPDDSAPDAYRLSSLWGQNFNQHWAFQIIVSCGPWIFDGMSDRMVRFKRNPDYFEGLAALNSSIEVFIKDSPDTIWQQFKMGGIDSYIIQPDQLIELAHFVNSDIYKKQKEDKLAIHQLDYVARSYAYIGWNETRPFFSNKKLRQAMTMAIDRKRIIDQILNGQGIEISGPFYRYSPSYDPSILPWPFDPAQARRLLEEEGWYDSTGTGIIDKVIDGKRVPFQFALTYYVKNPTTKAICEYVATALKEIGIDCSLNGVDTADLSRVFEDKEFDALVLGWVLGDPPEDPKQLWSSAGAKEKGSSNAIGFANHEIDAIIAQLEYEYNHEKRITLYHRFCQIIHEEAPYTFLYTPKTSFLYREYLKNVFIPALRQDLVPGANMAEPDTAIYWVKPHVAKEHL